MPRRYTVGVRLWLSIRVSRVRTLESGTPPRRTRYLPMRLTLTLAATLMLAACAADAQINGAQTPGDLCPVMKTFDSESAVAPWQTVLDGVMGGRSTGTRVFEDGAMVFQGTINTNGGGFSSICLPVQPGALDGAGAVTLRIKPDGRAYTLTFRTDQRYRTRPVSFQAPIPQTPPGEWADVRVPLDGLNASVFGRDVPVDTFNQDEVREIGILLADGVDGPFRLEIASLGCTTG